MKTWKIVNRVISRMIHRKYCFYEANYSFDAILYDNTLELYISKLIAIIIIRELIGSMRYAIIQSQH